MSMMDREQEYDMNNSLTIIEKFRNNDLVVVLAKFGDNSRSTARKSDLQKRVRDLLYTPRLTRDVINQIYYVFRSRVQYQPPQQNYGTHPAMRPQQPTMQHQMWQHPQQHPQAQRMHQPRVMMNPNHVRTAPVFHPQHPQHHIPPRQPYPQQMYNGAAAVDPRNVRFCLLPFYEVKEVLISQLNVSTCPKNENGSQFFHTKFQLPRQYVPEFCRQGTGLPKYEVQLRMCVAEAGKIQQEAYPNMIKVSINSTSVSMPPLMNVQPQPGQSMSTSQKRVSRPVDVSSQCQISKSGNCSFSMEWTPDRNQYVFGLWLVYHLSNQLLAENILNSCQKYNAETKMMITRLLGGAEEDDIAMDTCKISLLCPLARIVMKTPVRGSKCTHLQCFDLNNFIMMNEKRASWKCPVCNQPTLPSDLVLDQYFIEIINAINGKSSEVELLPDGSWKMIAEKYDEDKPSPAASIAPKQEFTPKAATINHHSPDEIIVLDDSDDEALSPAAAVGPSSLSTGNLPSTSFDSRKRTHEQISAPASVNVQENLNTSGSSVIILSDDEDRPSTINIQQNQPAASSRAVPPIQNQPTVSHSISTQPNFGGSLNANHAQLTDAPQTLLTENAMAEISTELISFLYKLTRDDLNFQSC